MTARMSRDAWWDLAVIGAGPAGSVLAGCVAARGKRVLLLERASFPREKLCGEFISPETRAYLGELSLLEAVTGAGAVEIAHVRIAARGSRPIERELPSPALGLSRSTLDSILARWAVSQGAELREHERVHSVRDARAAGVPAGHGLEVRSSFHGGVRTITARSVANAGGILGGGDAALRAGHVRPFVAVQRHDPRGGGNDDCARGTISLFPFRDGYCGTNEVEGERINTCLLVSRTGSLRPPPGDASAQGAAWLFEHAARENPHLRERFPQGPAASPICRSMAAGRVPPGGGRHSAPPARFAAALPVGDAAAMIAPLCGDGISMAIRSGMIAAEVILEGDTMKRCRARFAARWRREIAPRLLAGGLLHEAMQRPWLTRALAVSAAAWPPLVAVLFRNTRDRRAIMP